MQRDTRNERSAPERKRLLRKSGSALRFGRGFGRFLDERLEDARVQDRVTQVESISVETSFDRRPVWGETPPEPRDIRLEGVRRRARRIVAEPERTIPALGLERAEDPKPQWW
jgi:hypothetical protein